MGRSLLGKDLKETWDGDDADGLGKEARFDSQLWGYGSL